MDFKNAPQKQRIYKGFRHWGQKGQKKSYFIFIIYLLIFKIVRIYTAPFAPHIKKSK